MFKYFFNLFFFIHLLFAKDVLIEEIYLEGLITNPKQEISGMDWYNNNLFFLPENLEGYLFMITKNQIKKQISLKNKESISPKKTKFYTPNYSKLIPGFDGLEAIAFKDNKVYITIEAENNDRMESYIVWGTIDSESYDIKIDNDNIKKVETPIQIDNLSYESILIHKDNALLLYEANGANLQENPFQFLISLNDFSSKKIKFPTIEYRITDATKIINNKFWAINYYWPGDKKNLNPALDKVSKSKKGSDKTVERLVEFKITNNHIELTNEEPINLILESDKSRNWEGMVRLEESGFLIITDKYPRMIFAYVNLK
tara:strand:+ start:605 stop:1549 length:945 start_codon:yes stop_codon:yes gene_type:complete